MTSTLHQAIAAARAGEMARAQMLAADAVSQAPDDPNGWYLLSQLVESDARRAAYLSKTLALAPDHPRARAEFAALPPALVADLSPVAGWPPAELSEVDVVAPEMPEVMEYDAAAEWAESQTAETEAVAARPDDILPTPEELITDFLGAAPFPEPEPATAAAPDVPEWLQPLSPEPVASAAPALSQTERQRDETRPAAAPARPAAPRPARRPNTANRALSILLGLLAVLTLAVLAFLVYLLLF